MVQRCQKIILPSVQFLNTGIQIKIPIQIQIQIQTQIQIQIHKYSLWWSARKTQHMLHFWIADGSRMSKMGGADCDEGVYMWKTCATNDWWLGCKLEH